MDRRELLQDSFGHFGGRSGRLRREGRHAHSPAGPGARNRPRPGAVASRGLHRVRRGVRHHRPHHGGRSHRRAQRRRPFRQRIAAIKKMEGNPLDPITGGRLCARGQASVQALYHPDRLRGPMKRTGAARPGAVRGDFLGRSHPPRPKSWPSASRRSRRASSSSPGPKPARALLPSTASRRRSALPRRSFALSPITRSNAKPPR